MTLLDLPTELLDHVFSYLDWDRKENLIPRKPDIISAASTCRTIRRILLPAVFKDVVLRLRWSEGVLVEPCLFKLRKEHPDLAKHIRCVFIRTEFEQCPHCAGKGSPAFQVPPGIKDWMNPSGSLDAAHIGHAAYRDRADAIAQRLRSSLCVPEETDATAERIIQKARDSSSYSVEADALSIGLMLCFPVSTNTIVFQSLPNSSLHQSRNDFALRILATAIELLSSNLKDLILVSTAAVGMTHRALLRTQGARHVGDDPPLLTPDVIKSLKVNRLTFALADRPGSSNSRTQLSFDRVQLWHGVSDWVRELDIRNTSSEFNEALRCIKGFHSLQAIRFQESALYLAPPPVVPGQTRQMGFMDEPQQNTWLLFLIELRQAMRHVKIRLDQVHTYPTQTVLPLSALRWIQNEAVPSGTLIDADRQERLLTDFRSFIPLWSAEDGARGTQALESWNTQRSSLSDEAMGRRWR